MTTGAAAGCAEHGELGEEFRLLALALLDRFEPRARSVLAGLRVEAAEAAEAAAAEAVAAEATAGEATAGEATAGGATAGSATASQPVACQWCPVCSVIAVVRGDRPELGGRLAEQAGALLTTLRAVLEQPPNAPLADAQAADEQPADKQPDNATPGNGQPADEPRRPVVQRIEVRPAAGEQGRFGAGGGC